MPNEKGVVMEKHAFSLGGEFPEVPDNVQLVKGLFNESLPGFLENIDASGGMYLNPRSLQSPLCKHQDVFSENVVCVLSIAWCSESYFL